MRFAVSALLLSTLFLTGCSSNLPRVLNPGSATQALDLSPSPVELTNDTPVSSFTAQNDVAGLSYTPSTDPSCQTSSGGIYVAGDGQAQADVAGAPLMFSVYAAGTPPSTCTITVRSSGGDSATVDVSYQVMLVQAIGEKSDAIRMAVSPGVNPSATKITKLTQIISLAASGFSGTMTASVSGCPATGSGLQVSPKQIAGASGTFVVAAFGQGNVSFSCNAIITDSANNSVTVPITVAIGALNKFTVTQSGKLQFACAGTTVPKHCQTIQTIAMQEAGATSFAIADKPSLIHTCANSFNGPLKMVTTPAGAPMISVAGPTATVGFDGLLPTAALGCSRIVVTDGRSPEQTVNVPVDGSLAAAPPPAISAATVPACKGNDPLVAVPGAPHGMYVWNPNAFPKYLAPLANDVIGIDHTLCGASLVISWADLEPTKGNFNWQFVIDEAKPYTDKGLTVNLLFSDSTEGPVNNITPAWVTDSASAGGDGAPTVTCAGQPTIPVFFSQIFESDWEAFIATVTHQYSFNNSGLAPSVGYLRFATAGGAEALPPTGYNDGGACQALWTAAGMTYPVWKQHEINIVNTMAAQSTDKQMIVSLPGLSGGPNKPGTNTTDVYDMSNAVAAVAASKHIGFSFEDLGTKPVSPPAPCNPAANLIDLHWCQAYHTYAGVVPLNMQPITASSNHNDGTFDIADLLPYALDNNIQVFELYPDEWIQADSPEFAGFLGQAAHYKAALNNASLVLGVSP
jgi:hypothetical protein